MAPETVARVEEVASAMPWAVAGTTGAVGSGLVPSERELSAIRRSIAPPVFVGLDLDGLADLESVRCAGVIVAVGSDAGRRFGGFVDATVDGTPGQFVEELAAATAEWCEVGITS